jgi:hypothetical protein
MNKITRLSLVLFASLSIKTMVAQITLPITFESPGVTYTMIDFDGGTTSIENNPSATGINSSTSVLKMVKNAGQVWGGSKLTLSAPIDFVNFNTFKMKVYSPRANCPVLFKLEGPGGVSVEHTAFTTSVNTWEELTWDFTGAATNTYTDLVFIYDLGVMGDGSNNFTFYQDDIQLVNQAPTLSQLNLPVTFESTTVDYTMTDFGGNVTVYGVDPTNSANKVGITTKTASAQTWAGTTIGTSAGFASAIPFTANNHKMQLRIYSPDANIPVRLKAEVHGQPTLSVETEAMTTVANTWETLVFDFDNQAAGTAAFNASTAYDMLSVFFNFGTDGATAGNKIYLFDDVSIYTPSTPVLSQINLPVTFDATTVDYTLTDFGGNATVLGADPTNASNMVAITTKTSAAQLWAGTTIGTNSGFLNPIPFTANNHKMQVRVYSPDANIPVRLKAEIHGQPTISVETEAMTTVANAWETLVFDFDNQAAGTAAFNAANAYDMASIFFNFGTDGATAGTKVYMFDDVNIYTPTTPVLSQINLPVTFDATNVDYTVTDFGGNATVLGADPTNASNIVAITTKTSAAQLWAGTTIGTNSGFLNVIPFTASNHKMQVRVYSPDANIPIRLKAEVHGQPTLSVETEAMTTMANTWETLVFDFDNQAAGTAAFNATSAYDMASIFFNFGTDGATAGTKVYMFDDVNIFTPVTPVLTQINLPVTFDATTVNYTVTDFGGNATVLGADPTNASNTVAITTKTSAAQLWAGTTIGTNLGFLNAIPFTSTNHKMQVRVYSHDANIPVRLKAEVHGQPTLSVETEALTTVANAWETLVFNFDNQAAGTAAFNASTPYDMASIFFNFGTDGATAGTKVYMFDDVDIYDVTVNTKTIAGNNIQVYPNPASNYLFVTVNKLTNYNVVDLTGRVVLSGKIERNNIEISSLNNGIYILQLSTEAGLVSTRFTKQ